MMTTTPHTTTHAFRRGMSWGQKGIFRGNLCAAQSEEGMVEIIQNPGIAGAIEELNALLNINPGEANI